MSRNRVLALSAAVALLTASAPSHAYRLLQTSVTGRTDYYTAFNAVACGASGGFTHWSTANTNWYHNVSNQGSGKDADLYNAMNVWNFVSSANHTLTYKGRTSAAFATDGINVVSWGTSQGGCTTGNGCLALTALVLNSGQVIIESDITFNNGYTWSTNGTNYDVWEVAAHEFGHTLGIAHTDQGSSPTMYAFFSSGSTTQRSLESDDKSALQCVQSTYPPTTSCIPDGGVTDGSTSCCSGYTFGSYTNSDGTFSICASVGTGGCAGSGGVDDTNSSTSCCSGSAVTGSTRCLNPADYNNGWATCIHTCQ
jgi:hypothetical protein